MSIKVTTIPQAAASATSQQFLIECDEKLCRPCCSNGALQPVGSISLQAGTVTTMNGIAVVPLLATVVVANPTGSCGCCQNQVFVETVNIPFAETTSNTIAIAAGSTTKTELTNIRNCQARGVRVSATATVTIS